MGKRPPLNFLSKFSLNWISLSLPLFFSLSPVSSILFPSLSLYFLLSLKLCLSNSLFYLSAYISNSLSLSLSLSLSFSLSLYLSLYPFLSLTLHFTFLLLTHSLTPPPLSKCFPVISFFSLFFNSMNPILFSSFPLLAHEDFSPIRSLKNFIKLDCLWVIQTLLYITKRSLLNWFLKRFILSGLFKLYRFQWLA